MKETKLSKLKVDIDYIDPITMEKVCSFNQCIDKFTVKLQEEITTYPRWKNGLPLVKTSYFHACSECGRKHKSKTDKAKSASSFYEAAAGGGNKLNSMEMKKESR
jgi:hypothetical protein